jgi:hypothetical protein
MPDLQTALTTAIKSQVLSTTINEWEEEEQQTMQAATQPQAQPPIMQTQINGNTKTTVTYTGNMSKDIFIYIKENPGCLRADVRKVFIEVGYKESSIGSLISQMVRTNMVSINDVGNLEAIRVYYKPITGISKKKKLAKAIAKVKAQAAKPKAQGIAALAPEPTQDTAKGQEAIDKVLALPVREARAVYDALCLLRDLNVGEARHLYTELQKLFGG